MKDRGVYFQGTNGYALIDPISAIPFESFTYSILYFIPDSISSYVTLYSLDSGEVGETNCFNLRVGDDYFFLDIRDNNVLWETTNSKQYSTIWVKLDITYYHHTHDMRLYYNGDEVSSASYENNTIYNMCTMACLARKSN